MMWLEAIYQPTALFSLRPSWTTSSGGKSLLLPSPFALKMALFDAAFRTTGWAQAKDAWPWIRNLDIGIRLPRHILVTNLFIRILRVKEIKTAASGKESAITKAKEDQSWPFARTIAYREFVFHPGVISLAIAVPNTYAAQLADWLTQINYLGKRGGFVQLMALPRPIANADGYTLLTGQADSFPLAGIVQQLDDCDPQMTFEEANIYESRKPKRVVRHIVLPYRLARSSRAYSLYEYSGA